jgi:hypothetical protein
MRAQNLMPDIDQELEVRAAAMEVPKPRRPAAARPTPAERRARLVVRLLGLLVLALLIAVGSLSYRMYRLESLVLPRNSPALATPRPVTPRGDLLSGEKARIRRRSV